MQLKELIVEKIFQTLAKEVSKSSNAQNGGLMPWRRAIEMPELFSNAVNKKK